MTQGACTRCGWCCQHVMIKLPNRFKITSAGHEWFLARGIRIYRNQMVIPSRCDHLNAIQIKNDLEQWVWVCNCKIQDTKPKECAEKDCVKIKFPGIDTYDLQNT